MTSAQRRPGPESTLTEVRSQLIDAGVDLLAKSGVAIGLEQVKLTTLIAACGVTRATAYRSLADDELDPQEKLRKEVLTRLLVRSSAPEHTAIVADAVNEVIATHSEKLASDDVRERSWVMRELIRVGSEASFEAVSQSQERSILLAAYGSLGIPTRRRSRVAGAAAARWREGTDR